MIRLNSFALAGLIGLTLLNSAFALPEDRDKAITGKALTTKLDANTGKTILSGKVKITQGALSIFADQVILESDPTTNKLTYMLATGAPVTFVDTPNANEAPIEIQGKQIEFFPGKNLVITLGDAVINQAGNSAKGERIQYDTVTGIMTIESDIVVNNSENGAQAEFILQPGVLD